jgi:hypothetical protein
MPDIPGVIWLTPEQAWADYEAAAREGLGISADEAEAAWAAGDFDDRIEEPAVLRLYFVRAPRPAG